MKMESGVRFVRLSGQRSSYSTKAASTLR